ncbi:MAG: hypothetical protein JNG84_11480, partial [Archangium sp.]|nr:hypothetical protein [Archangium sp.]
MQRNAAVLQRLVLIVDALVLPVSATLAFAAHDLLRQHFPFFREPVSPSQYAVLVYLAVPVWVALDAGLGLSRVFQRRWTPVELFVDLVKVHLLWLLALTAVAFIGNGVINRSVLVLFLLVNLTIVFLLRLALGAYIQFSWTQGGGQTTWLLVGAPSAAMQTFLRDAQAEPFAPKVLGVLVPDGQAVGALASLAAGGFPDATGGVRAAAPHAPLVSTDVSTGARQLPAHAVPESASAVGTLSTLGTVDALSEVLRRNTVDAVIFFPPLHHPDVAVGPLRQCEEAGISAAFAV